MWNNFLSLGRAGRESLYWVVALYNVEDNVKSIFIKALYSLQQYYCKYLLWTLHNELKQICLTGFWMRLRYQTFMPAFLGTRPSCRYCFPLISERKNTHRIMMKSLQDLNTVTPVVLLWFGKILNSSLIL